jgi:hypothetical protein
MAIVYARKGEARRAVELRQRNASAIRRGRTPLVIAATTERKEGKRGK